MKNYRMNISLLKNIFSDSVKKLSHIEFAELTLLSVLVISALIYFSFTNFLNGDEREHVTATFFIYSGKIPYRDFFEHHHPLLWYTFLPFLHFFNNSENIWYVARFYTLLLFLINSFFIFKTSLLILPNRFYAWLCVLLSLVPHCVFLSQTEFRPDALMMTTFIIGTYYLFSYLKEPKKQLNLSFLFYFLSLMALQKICFQFIPIALLILYYLYKKAINLKDFTKALILPTILSALYILYLYFTDSLKDYFELNWLLNLKIHTHIQYPVHQTAYYTIANILALLTLCIKAPKFLKISAFLGLTNAIILQFIFIGAFRHYWLPLYPFFALICAYYVCTLIPQIRNIVLAIIIISVTHNYILQNKINKNYPSLQTFVYLSKQELNYSTKDDLVLNNSTIGGLRNSAAGYYWIGTDHVALLDNHYFKRHELPDFYNLIKTKKPKLFSTDLPRTCIDNNYHLTFDCIHHVPSPKDKEFLEKNYNNQGFIYIRKD